VRWLAALVLLSACSDLSKETFAAKIDESLQALDKICWKIEKPKPTFPQEVLLDGSVFNGLQGSGNGNPILQGLVDSKLITVTYDKNASNGEAWLGDMFGRPVMLDLTAKGRSLKVWDADAQGFCIGKQRLDEVVSWTSPADVHGVLVSEVKYTWKIGERPAWLDADKFANVPGMKSSVEGMALAQKKSGSWHVD